ncbi:MAG: nicotinate-nucleotide--dimethylbenzimidazole phosphoribosyltransferase [Pseudomonadota bacterium]|jgi:nicotinate-nucleotide--dimethylbenzimidazole phosphoribosyltransferase
MTDTAARPAPEADLRQLLIDAPAPNVALIAEVRRSIDAMAAHGGLGAEAEQAVQRLAGWRREGRPMLQRPILCLYAASYVWRPEAASLTRAQLEALAQGEGAANGLARAQGAGVEAFDLALDRPSPDAAHADVMSVREAAATAAFGMEALAKTPDLLMLGSMALGQRESAAALALAAGIELEAGDWSRAAAARAVAQGVEAPLDLLRRTSGRDVAALLGALIAARSQGAPVVLEGPAALAAALVAKRLHPSALDHVAAVAGTCAVCRAISEALELPVLTTSLGPGPGEGVSALATLAVLRLAAELFDL